MVVYKGFVQTSYTNFTIQTLVAVRATSITSVLELKIYGTTLLDLTHARLKASASHLVLKPNMHSSPAMATASIQPPAIAKLAPPVAGAATIA